jgi:hypothetical protein
VAPPERRRQALGEPALGRELGLVREQQAPVRARAGPVAASQPAEPIHNRRDSGDVADRRLRWSRRAAIAPRSGNRTATRSLPWESLRVFRWSRSRGELGQIPGSKLQIPTHSECLGAWDLELGIYRAGRAGAALVPPAPSALIADMASAIMEPTSATLAGSTSVLLFFASSPN